MGSLRMVRYRFVLLTLLGGIVLAAGCAKEEPPKGEGGATYYSGPMKNEKSEKQ